MLGPFFVIKIVVSFNVNPTRLLLKLSINLVLFRQLF